MTACLITIAICTVLAAAACQTAYIRGQNSTLTVVLKRLSDLADADTWDGVERRSGAAEQVRP